MIDFDKIRNGDIVGNSTITTTAPRGYPIADKIWAMDIPFMMGGSTSHFYMMKSRDGCVMRFNNER